MNYLRWLVRRRTNTDLAREVGAHIAERVDDLLEQGLSAADARAQARREFGNATLHIEQSREVWIAPWVSSVSQDVRYAVRSLTRQPGFTLSAVGILGIGIAFITAFFSVLNATLARPWRVPDPSTLAVVKPRPAPGQQYGVLSVPEYLYLRGHNQSFVSLATHTGGGGPVVHADVVVDVQSRFVSANYFDTLGITMMLGRGFLPEEEDYRSPRAVAVISERLWRDVFGAPTSILGSTIRVRDRPFTVIGVAPPGFFDIEEFPREVWMPLPALAIHFGDSWLHGFTDPRATSSSVFGRLRPGVSRESAQAELDVLSRQFRSTVPMAWGGFSLHSTRPIDVDRERHMRQLPPQAAAFVALFLIMLLACANVGNLLLARGLSRQREIAIRLSLGASRRRVARQLVTESLVISLGSAIVAVGLAAAALRILVRVMDLSTAWSSRLMPDAPVLAFATTMGLVACVVSGVLPALRSTRVDSSARGAAGQAGAGRLRTGLLATQLALSMVLLIAAGLFTRAVGQAATIDPGFAIHDVQAIEIQMPEGTTTERRSVFARALRDALDAADLPPVAFSNFPAITTARLNTRMRREGESGDMGRTVLVRPVSSRYFSVLDISILEGRSFHDKAAEREVVVNEAAARLFWPDRSAVGRRLVAGEGATQRNFDVVGIAANVPVTSPTDTEPVLYWRTESADLLLVRDLSSAMAERVQSVVRGIEPQARVTARLLADDLGKVVRRVAVVSRIAWAVGLLALLLATVGAFGVFAYMVEERRREIAVRIAIGAQPRQVVWTVIRDARRPLVFGLGAGLLLSSVVGLLLGRFLYGLSPFDPITYAGISVILITAAVVAMWTPARRATLIEPAIVLRGD